MKSNVRAWSNRNSSTSKALFAEAPAALEMLEKRTLLSSGGPQVVSIVPDNRGQVQLTLSQNIRASTVNSSTAMLLTAGPDAKLGTADDVAVPVNIQVSGKVIYLTANTPANKLYRVVLTTAVKGTNGRALFGNSGRGARGGNYDETTTVPNFIAHFNTSLGIINITLSNLTPITNQNFLNYANGGAWDGTFFHREEPSPKGTLHVLQGGGFNVNSSDQVGTVPTTFTMPQGSNTGIALELTGQSNVRGTIAMARTSDPNSGTSQFFFNTQSNTALDTVGGGYAVFGHVTDAASQAVLDKLVSAARVVDLSGGSSSSPYGEVPALNYTSGRVDPLKNLEIIFRASFLMTVLPTVQAGVISPAVARPAAVRAGATAVFSTAPITVSTAAVNSGGGIFALDSKKDMLA